MSTSRGLLIVLEGLDGAGTTSQARQLVASLQAAGHATHGTREPTDGPIGKLLRSMLGGAHAVMSTDGQAEMVHQNTFSLLFAADRVDHLQREVMPALASGAMVVSDRWYHSSLAYQGTGAERAWIRQLNARALQPDLTLLLRVRPEVAAARRKAAGRVDEIFEDLPMQQQVAKGYDEVMEELAADGERIEILDGEASIDQVATAILAAVTALMAQR